MAMTKLITKEEIEVAEALVASGNFEHAKLWAKGTPLEWSYRNELAMNRQWRSLDSVAETNGVQFTGDRYIFRLAPRSITIKHWVVVDFTNNETTIRKTEKAAKALQKRLERTGYKTKLVEITEEVKA